MDRKKTVVIIDKDKKIDYSWLELLMKKGNTEAGRFLTAESWEQSIQDTQEEGIWYCFNQSAMNQLKCILECYDQENKRAARELSEMVHQTRMDPLTGVMNRTGVIQKIEEILKKEPYEQGALCFLDMDDFKRVNDTYGHSYGDQVLMELASRLKILGDKDAVVGRFGGDEFLIFLRCTEGKEDIFNRAETVCQNLEIGKSGQYLSASIGVAVYPDDGRSFGELLQKADKALYSSKCHGKNRVMFY